MLADILKVVSSTYIPMIAPFMIIMMALVLSEHIIDVIKDAVRR